LTPDLLALLLAQMCVAELSLPAPTGECLIQWHAQDDLAEQAERSLEAQVRAYTPIFKRKRNGEWLKNGERRAWIRALTPTAAEPEHWPANASWAAVAPAWLAVYEAAQAFLAGKTLSPCPEAEHYGGRCDDDRGACDPPRECMARVDCGETSQAYWRLVPGCKGSIVIPAGVAAGVPEHVEGG
jgi:hypothetical protein